MPTWFPSELDKSPSWRFDVISLVAVLGDSTITEHVQALTASWLCLLPRLIPAPQALVKSTRPKRLPSVPALIVGIHSGMRVDELNFYANLIHDVGSLKPLQFKEYRITRNLPESALENGNFPQQPQSDEKTPIVFPVKSMESKEVTPTVTIKLMSPLNIITTGSVLLTIGLLVWSCLIHDGIAAIAISTMSVAAVCVGLATCWTPRLTIRTCDARVPPGDVVIRTREGAFIIVHCVEEITRELYTGTEYAEYWINDRLFKGFVGIGMVLLMIAVVLLGNCSWVMQIAIGAAYLLLNSAYWIAALLPKEWFWDLSHYNVEEITPEEWKMAHEKIDGSKPSFTKTLWYAIHRSGRTEWVVTSGAAPKTPVWDEWVEQASRNIKNADWDAVEVKNRLIEDSLHGITSSQMALDIASNSAPATVPGSS
ncbi:hypothetical protein CPB86DRAFT_788516 [Serendipita vermifera]|nr:hypothetical protein CPB86DRAFT_788516 [Serendipita vermifera]